MIWLSAFNRKHFNQVMKQLIGDFKRTNRVFSLALIDLDYFKNVNDTYGHLIGDEVLQGLFRACEEFHPSGGYLLPLWGRRVCSVLT